MENTNLTAEEKLLLDLRFGLSQGPNSLEEISQTENIDYEKALGIISSGLQKIVEANTDKEDLSDILFNMVKALPQEQNQTQEAKRITLQDIQIGINKETISFTNEEIKEHFDKLAFFDLKHLREHIPERLKQIAETLELSAKDIKQLFLDYPLIVFHLPETISNNVQESAGLLGINKDEFVKAALKQPPLFCQKPETIKHNFETLKLLFDNDLEKTSE